MGMEFTTRRREQEVWQACDDLWALHGDLKNLTGDAIRERLVTLGKSRGSPNEIYRYRKSWGCSRGIGNEGMSLSNADSDDPITRAVRLVHEKLQAETAEQMEKFKEEFQKRLVEKDVQLAKLKEDLDLTLEEFSKMSRENLNLNKELKERTAQLEAEIAVRQAIERELMAEKKEHAQALKVQTLILTETKEAHQSLVNELKAINETAHAAHKLRLEHLEKEKRDLAHQLSEQINELKVRDYNQKQRIESFTQKLDEQKSIGAKQASLIDEQRLKLTSALEEIASSARRESGLLASVAILKDEKRALEYNRHKEVRAMKRSELTIARLRALLAHGKG